MLTLAVYKVYVNQIGGYQKKLTYLEPFQFSKGLILEGRWSVAARRYARCISFYNNKYNTYFLY